MTLASGQPATVLDLVVARAIGSYTLLTSGRQSQITGLDIVDITLPAFETTENAWFKQGNL